MFKDFDLWNAKKKIINTAVSQSFCHPREIWWCSLGVNVGVEEDGTGRNFDRPVVVIRGFNQYSFLAVPLTGKKKIGHYYFSPGLIAGREATALLSQIRIIDSKRLIKKIGTLNKDKFLELKNALQQALFSWNSLPPSGSEAEALCI